MAFCTQCGKQIPDDSKYCPFCGSDVIPKPKDAGQRVAQSAPFQAQGPQSYQQNAQQVQPQNQPRQNAQQYQPQNQPQSQPQQFQQPYRQQYQMGQQYQKTNYNQQQFYQPGQQNIPSKEPEQPKKKSKVWLIILLVILGAALLGGSIYGGILYARSLSGNENAQDGEESSKQGKGGKESSQTDDGEESKTGKDDKEESSTKDDSSKNDSSDETASESSGDTSEESTSESSSESSEEESEPEPEPEVVFHVVPIQGISSIKEIHINSNASPEWDYFSCEFERTGYPQQWTATSIYSNIHYQAGVFQFAVGSGASLRYGVMDYEGNVLFEPILEQEIIPLWYRQDYLGVMSTPEGYQGWIYFNSDFSTMTAEEILGFGYVSFPYYYYYEEELYFFDGEKTTGPVAVPETLKGALVPILEKKLSANDQAKDVGYYYIKSDGTKVEQNGCIFGVFANGYYAATEDINSLKLALIEPNSGEPICEFMYDEVQYFVEGYCAVKRNGKWGLINEYGEEVISCCFDSMSSVYKGKIAVMLDGEFAVIDLTASLEDGAVLTKDIITKAFNDQAFTSGYVAPDPTQHFMVWIPYNNLYIRTGAGTNYSHLSYFIPPGAYEIVEVQSGTGSTAGWGKLANGDGWVALDFCFKF